MNAAERLFFIGEALRRDVSIEEIHEYTKIDLFFLNKMKNIIFLSPPWAGKGTFSDYLVKNYGFVTERANFGVSLGKIITNYFILRLLIINNIII